MLLNGIGSEDAEVVQAATDIMLALKEELPDPVAVLTSLISSTVSLGIPRASGHLYLVGKLLANASHDRALAATLGNSCFGRRDGHGQRQQQALAIGDRSGQGIVPGHGGSGAETRDEGEELRGFGAFLAAQALSTSCSDHTKSDVLFVALELLDCCMAVCMGAGIAPQASMGFRDIGSHGPLMPPPPGGDPFVSIMLALPRLLARRSSSDELLQLHGIAYLATVARYCRQRTEMGVPGWSSNRDGVPDVLAELFEGAREATPREVLPTGGGGESSMQPFSGGMLCSTLKTLLMSSSYRVRSATARLITSLCRDVPFGEDSEQGHENVAMGSRRNGSSLFFREILLAAGSTDFLFEAIKSEREGSTRYYLEAAEAFASSPVEFFHADNFCMKFAAPILLDAFRGGTACGPEPYDRAGGSRSDDEATVVALSSRLLLQALVTVPSSGGVMEELLATAAVSPQSDLPNKTRAIGLAADVLSLVASGDISLSKDRGNFLDAVKVLLEHLEEDLECAACLDFQKQQRQQQQAHMLSPGEGMCDKSGGGRSWPGQQEGQDDGGLVLQCARVYESLLHTAEEWVSSLGSTVGGTSCQASAAAAAAAANRFGGGGRRGIRGEESVGLADLVFGSYERTLSYQCNLIAQSENLAHDVAWLSCLGAAVDATSAVLFHKRQREEAAARGGRTSKNGTMGSWQLLNVRPSFVNTQELDRDCSGGSSASSGGAGGGEQEYSIAPGEVSIPASCLETILKVVVEADVVSWMLDLYARCGGDTSSGGTTTHSSQSSERSSDVVDAHGATTCALLMEVLQSLLDAQGWVNGVCAHGADRPSHEMECGGRGSTFGETVRLMLQSWTTRGVSGAEEVHMPLDQHVMSQLGKRADNGDLCKLVVLLVSVSPSFLGVLHPHVGCRIDSAVTLLRYIKTLPEAVFCLNLFSHIVLVGGDKIDGGRGGELSSRLSEDLSAAVKDLLARFSVEEVALSLIPLSASAISFALLAGCEASVSDWLVAAPLARVKRTLTEFGAFCERQGDADDDTADLVVGCSERVALKGILGAILHRWGVEAGKDSPHHSQSDAVIYRLACVLLMSPDTLLSLAFDSDSHPNGSIASALATIIPETLEGLSAALSPVVSRHGDRGNTNYLASKLECASCVSQIASAFLRARCTHGYYTTIDRDVRARTGFASCQEPPEIPLARACGGLLQGMLRRRRGQGSFGDGGDSTLKALLSVLNLLGALLVLVGRDSFLLRQAKQGLVLALQESRAALSEMLASTAVATERLTGWLDHAPDVLAAFIQVCVISNALESTCDGFGGGSGHSLLVPPFQVLGEVFSSGGSGPCFVEGGGGINHHTKTKLPEARAVPSIPRRVVRRSLLQVLAVRCVEGAAQTGFFSGQEVLALQLALQGIACHGGPTLASAAHGAIQALWESYSGVLQSADLVGQSWNPFMVECSLDNALRSLSRDQESGAGFGLLPSEEDPDEFRVGASVLVSAIGRLLSWSAGKTCLGLRTSGVLAGCNIELLSATAVAAVCRCTALLATNLRIALGDDTVQRDDRLGKRPRLGCQSSSNSSSRRISKEMAEDGGIGGDGEKLHLLDALTRLVDVLTCIEPSLSQAGLDLRSETRKELLDALVPLHSALAYSREGGSMRHEKNWEQLEQVSMPLSRGAYHDGGRGHGESNSYEGVFFVKYDNWWSISGVSGPLPLAELARKVERFVELLSRTPGAGLRIEGCESHAVQDEDSSIAKSATVA
ncbi:unnamed protein product [Ectocarpus sp. 6 AP-2014]